jgi:hypothetical protein
MFRSRKVNVTFICTIVLCVDRYESWIEACFTKFRNSSLNKSFVEMQWKLQFHSKFWAFIAVLSLFRKRKCGSTPIRGTWRSVCVSAWISGGWGLNWWLANGLYVVPTECGSRGQASYTRCSTVSPYLDRYVLTLEPLSKSWNSLFLIHLSKISHLTRSSVPFSCPDWLSLSLVSLIQ